MGGGNGWGSFKLLSLVFVWYIWDTRKVFPTFLDQPDPDTPCNSPTTTAEPTKSTSENGGQGCDVGLEREKNIGTNDRWCQTWSYILISKCEMHETLVVIHWLTINAKKVIFIQMANPRKSSSGCSGRWKGMGELRIALTCVCMPCLRHMKGLHNLPWPKFSCLILQHRRPMPQHCPKE